MLALFPKVTGKITFKETVEIGKPPIICLLENTMKHYISSCFQIFNNIIASRYINNKNNDITILPSINQTLIPNK